MSLRPKRILLAVRDVTSVPAATLGKSATLARASGATLELFHVMDESVSPHAVHGRAALPGYAERLRRAADHSSARLARIARSPRLRGIQVKFHTAWEYPVHEAIVRRALATRADLVIAETHRRVRGARLFLANTDWELIRHCPCPLLLLKTSGRYDRPVVLAAVDPFHAHAKPADLDTLLVRKANEIAELLRGTVHLFHSYVPAVAAVPVATVPVPAVDMSPELLQLEAQRRKRTFDRIAEAARIPASRRHLYLGEVASELDAVVSKTRARIVVMGAVSRSGLRRLFIGSTAERVLDRLRCDVLIVKPRGFRTSA